MSGSAIHSKMVDAGDLSFHVLEAGEGPPVLCLHGFPDHSGTWRPLMQRLGGSFRVIAPDQRGYNFTSRPVGVEAYRAEVLVADMITLLDALSIERVAVCGNDWGGLIAFYLAMQHPDRISHVISLNSVHPYIFQELIWDHPGQRKASQYFNKLRAPDAAASFTKARREEMISAWYQPAIMAGLMTDADVEAYRQAWAQPGVWDAMLNWYRASPMDVPGVDDPAPSERWADDLDFKIQQPVFVLWGEDDSVFVPECATALKDHADPLEIVWLDGVGHTPQRQSPDRCAQEISRFLSEYPR